MPKKEPIFNTRKRRVFRSIIPRGEAIFGGAFLLFVVLMGAWVAVQRDNFDPTERDITMELMEEGSVQDTLYRTPFQHWRDPTAPAPGAAGARSADLGIFPAATLDGGWSAATRVQTFNEETLYEKIDGAAPQYFGFGFVTLHFIGMENPAAGVELSVELYDMGAFENALGIFAAQRDAGRAVDAMGPVYFYNTGIGAIGMIDRYYFKITGSDEGPEIEEKAAQLLAAFFALAGEDAAPPKPFLVLRDALGIPFEGIAFEKSDVFQFQFAHDFWFGTPDKNGGLRYYIHQAAGEAAAIELYDLLLENQLYDYDEIERTEDFALLNHKFLDTRLALKRTGALLFGFDGAPPELNTNEVLTTLQEAFLSDEEEN